MKSQLSKNPWKSVRTFILFLIGSCLLIVFVVWRIDSQRVERFRVELLDRLIPNFNFVLVPVGKVGRMLNDFRSYGQLYEQNQELKRDLQNMKNWKEAALQLRLQNTQLRTLNNLKLNPNLSWITGEIIADSGSPFNQSGLINIGLQDGIKDGSAVVDGLGLLGRISGVGRRTARVIFLTDVSSSIPVIIRPSGQRALLSGDNSKSPILKFVDDKKTVRAGFRIVTSGDGGVLPSDLLIGTVSVGSDGKLRSRLAAEYKGLNFVRVLELPDLEVLNEPGNVIK